jgi:hypothetical protein
LLKNLKYANPAVPLSAISVPYIHLLPSRQVLTWLSPQIEKNRAILQLNNTDVATLKQFNSNILQKIDQYYPYIDFL